MADITVQNLTKYYGDRLILKDISFDIQPGEKVAILGANGAGKTTLLNILTGRLSYDGGHVAFGQGRTAGVIDQMPDFPPESTVEDILRLAFKESDEVAAAMDALTDEMTRKPDDASLLKRYAQLETRLEILGGYNRDYEINRVCNGLEIAQEMRSQKFDLLSGGEKTRINLARIILEQTDVLLLDEPTNHLDMDAVDWLGNYLENYRGTVLIISHDRWFIDQCCDRVIEIHDCTCDFYNGNYSYYAVERERRREEQLKHHEHELAEKKRLEATARSMHEHGTEHLAKRAASIEKRIARMKVTDRPKTDKKMTVTFGDPNYETEEVLKVRDITKSYDGREILHNVSFNIRNRERVALLGANGAGKTTMLKILLGEEVPDGGVIRKGVGLKPAYLPQQVYFANPHRNLIDTLIYDKNVSMQVARNRLGSFQFTGETQLKTVDMLSGGEKSRLRLCELMYDPLNLLILDEPTNHLDLASREWIEEAVEAFDGTLLFVSHDRYFLDAVCTRIWELRGKSIKTYRGNYSAYLPQREAADERQQKLHDAAVEKAAKLQDYVDRNLVRASTTKMAQSRRKQLEKLEITEAPKDETNQLKFRFEYDVEPWNELVLLKNLTIRIGDRTLLEPFTYTVCRGQRLIIAGPNGAGKSTLMQVLDGKRRPSGGMVRLGTGARPSIFAQQQNRLGQGRVIDVIWNKYPRMTELEVRNHLAKLGFRGETVFKPCEALSGGELARLRFAEIVLERPNLLFLDEPTNHLDIYTRENLTEALMAYTGTLLLVTHDRHLMNSLACPILYLEDGKATIYPSYDALMGRSAPAPAVQKAAEPAKIGYGKEQRRRRAELRAKIKACEDEMEACGAREVELDNEINSPEVYNDPDLLRQKSDELSDLRFHQEELFAAWEAAMEEQESYEQSQTEE